MISDAGARKLRRLAVIGLALALGACSAATFSEMPSQVGGLPAGTPERAATPTGYPAVHDMPPPRTDITLTKEEQKKATAELAAAREGQAKKIEAADKGQ